MGIPLSIIKKNIFGESHPTADNSSIKGKALNRRVCIRFE
jgi:hypothetical protein